MGQFGMLLPPTSYVIATIWVRWPTVSAVWFGLTMIEYGTEGVIVGAECVASEAIEVGAVVTAEQAATTNANGIIREGRSVLSFVVEFKMDSSLMREAAILEWYKARTVPEGAHRLNPLWSRELRDYSCVSFSWFLCPRRGQLSIGWTVRIQATSRRARSRANGCTTSAGRGQAASPRGAGSLSRA